MGKIIDRVRAQKQFAECNRWEGVKSPGAITPVYMPERRRHDLVPAAKFVIGGMLAGLIVYGLFILGELVREVLR